jgi:hypothetical protein
VAVRSPGTAIEKTGQHNPTLSIVYLSSTQDVNGESAVFRK